MKRGDLIFVRGKSPLSFLIRFFDKGEFSHVAIAIDENHVIDSQYPLGVRIRHFRFKDYEIIKLPVKYNVEKLRKYIGYNYDFKQFIWYMFKVGKVWNTPNQFICSELVSYYLDKPEWKNLTPNELYKKIHRND